MTATQEEVEAMAAVLCSAFDAVGEDPSFIEAADLLAALAAKGFQVVRAPGGDEVDALTSVIKRAEGFWRAGADPDRVLAQAVLRAGYRLTSRALPAAPVEPEEGREAVRMEAEVIDVLDAGTTDDGLSMVELVGSDGGPEGFNLFLLHRGRGENDWRGERFVLTLRPVAAAPAAPAEPVWGAGSEYNDAAAWEPAAVGGPGDPEATVKRLMGHIADLAAGQPGEPEDRA